MTMVAEGTGSGLHAELAVPAAFFHGLADPTRLAILRQLAHGEARIVDLTDRFALAQSTVSTHVACLRDCGLVQGRPQGRQVFYSLTRIELLDVLTSAQTLLAVIGTQVTLCPRFGLEAPAATSSTELSSRDE